MKINDQGLLQEALYKPSPHCDSRPESIGIDMIVIHGISLPPGEFGQQMVEPFFCGTLDMTLHPFLTTIAHLKVSSHLFIDRGGKIIQFVPFPQRAWHAGTSIFQGRVNCNDFSIGIELEGTDDIPYEKIQYEKLAVIIPTLMKTYPSITTERLVGHSDVAPARKTDPGPAFDWHYLSSLIHF